MSVSGIVKADLEVSRRHRHQYPAPGLPEGPDDDRSYLRLLDDCIG